MCLCTSEVPGHLLLEAVKYSFIAVLELIRHEIITNWSPSLIGHLHTDHEKLTKLRGADLVLSIGIRSGIEQKTNKKP